MVEYYTPDYPDFDDGGKDDLYVTDDAEYEAEETVDIKENDVTVAAPKAKNILFIALGGLVVLLIMYNVVFGDKRTEKEIEVERAKTEAEAQPIIEEEIATPPAEEGQTDYVAVVDAPEIPGFVESKTSIESDSDNIPFMAPGDIDNEELFGNLFGNDEPVKEQEEEKEPDIEVFNPIRVDTSSELLEDMSLPPGQQEAAKPAPPPLPKGPTKEERRARDETYEQERSRLKDLYTQGFAAGGTIISKPSEDKAAAAYLAPTQAKQIAATTIGNADNVIGQGKTIDAIMETAVNTELDGPVRAIVSRDIYGETGRRVLIPRGSRLSGSYQTALLGETGCRLSITWQRVILPDGTDVNISLEEGSGGFPATDQLGRAGICGYVDDKYFETIASAALLSTVTIAAAGVADKISAEENAGAQSTTTQPDGAVTQTNSQQSATDQTILTSLGAFGKTAGEVITKMLGNGRVIIIPQGTRMRVFVQNDIVFPSARSKLLR